MFRIGVIILRCNVFFIAFVYYVLSYISHYNAKHARTIHYSHWSFITCSVREIEDEVKIVLNNSSRTENAGQEREKRRCRKRPDRAWSTARILQVDCDRSHAFRIFWLLARVLAHWVAAMINSIPQTRIRERCTQTPQSRVRFAAALASFNRHSD